MLNKIKIGSAFLILAFIASVCTHKSDNWIEHRVVKLVSPHGSCSGEQVRAPSGVDYILTASHCAVLADTSGSITVITEDGNTLKRKILDEDGQSDLLLLEGVPNLHGLSIAHSDAPKDIVRTFTHGKGFDTYQTSGTLIQETSIYYIMELESCKPGMKKYVTIGGVSIDLVTGQQTPAEACIMQLNLIGSTAFTSPGSSGGPVVDTSGDLVGVVSGGDGHYSYFVTLEDIQRFLTAY